MVLSLLLSKELFGAGGFPALSTCERQRLHSNVVSVFRRATSQDHNGEDHVEHLLSDAALLHAYALPAPFTFVRFAWLRSSIRMILKAPLELLALAYESRSDSRSWLSALFRTWYG